MLTRTAELEEFLLDYIRNECLSKNSSGLPGYGDDLFEAGIVDSAGLISFIAFIEKEFSITIPDEDLLPENFKSVSAIAGYIRKNMK